MLTFSVIIGNPPYKCHREFIEKCISLQPCYFSMIIPCRWFGGVSKFNHTRKLLIGKRQLKNIVYHTDTQDCFPNVQMVVGINYFLWDKKYNGDLNATIIEKNSKINHTCDPLEFKSIVLSPIGASIIRTIQKKKYGTMDLIIKTRDIFNISSNDKGYNKGELKLLTKHSTTQYPIDKMSRSFHEIAQWKVVIIALKYELARDRYEKETQFIFYKLQVVPPYTIFTDSFLMIYGCDNETEAENVRSYLNTRLPRYLIYLTSVSSHITSSKFLHVPIVDFTRSWDNDSIMKHFNFNKKQISEIENRITPQARHGKEPI